MVGKFQAESRHNVQRPLAIAIALGVFHASVVLAQENEAKLKEMTVSGKLSVIEEAREQSTLGGLTMDKPMAGSILNREDIEIVKSVTSLYELLSRVPGVSKSRNMRIAVGGKNYTDNRVDGLRVSPTGTYGFVDQTNNNDIERVEFINGPGSVLQSSYAIGGTINVITRDPPKDRELKVSQEVGDYNFYRTDVNGGGTFQNGFGYTVDGNIMRNKGWRDRSQEDKDSFSMKFGGKPDQYSSLHARIEYLYDDALYPGQLTEAQFDANWQQAQPGVYGRGMSKYVTPSIHYKRQVGEKGEFIFAASRRTVDSTTYGNTATYTTFSNTIGVSKQTVTSTQAIYRQDFDFAASRLYVGLENMSSDSDSKQFANLYTNAQGLLGNFAPGAQSATTSNSKSNEKYLTPFINYELSPIDKLRLHLGVRADNVHYTVDDRTTKNKDGEATFKKNVPKLGATYDFNPNNLVWASYAEGFLAPGVSTLLGSGTPGNTNNAGNNGYVPAANLKPEEMQTYEIGFRGYVPNSRFRYDVALYRTEIANMVIQRDCLAAEKVGPTGCYKINENVGSTLAKGIETGLSAAAMPWLDIALSHTLAIATYETYKSTTYDYSGKNYNFTPRHHLNARLMFKPAPGWRAELEGDYESEYYLDSGNTETYKRPALYHLRTSYTDPGNRWSAWLHILNLSDVKYAPRMSVSGTTRTYNDGYAPLTLRAGVSYKF
ncbi:MAG: TonB-dependent receptor [Sulfuritalea sp.]|jgi:outer membrane receptor protein involved in Fe transport|nr:TonB-dependent receptor [Sulfuritalea sp.]